VKINPRYKTVFYWIATFVVAIIANYTYDKIKGINILGICISWVWIALWKILTYALPIWVFLLFLLISAILIAVYLMMLRKIKKEDFRIYTRGLYHGNLWIWEWGSRDNIDNLKAICPNCYTPLTSDFNLPWLGMYACPNCKFRNKIDFSLSLSDVKQTIRQLIHGDVLSERYKQLMK
jgi:hypothetical protein